MNTFPRIAIVEDDQDLRLSTEEFLSVAGYAIWGVGSAEEFYRQFISNPVDIVILDLGLPGDDGLTVANLLQNNPQVAVIILSARDATEDRLAGFRAGADRYLVKPVNLMELAANIDAVAKRLQLIRLASEPDDPLAVVSLPSPPANTAQVWSLNAQEWCLYNPSRQELHLTSREFVLLNQLIVAEGQVVAKKELCLEIFGPRIQNASDRLNVLIARLRKKALDELGQELPIKTVHQLGYAFTAAASLG